MITELSFSQQSRLFAQLSMLAYLPKQEAVPLFAAEGLSATLYTNQHSTAYLLECEDDLVLVFRGTIYQDFNTVKVNFKVSKVPASIGCGHKHRGFKEAVDSLWPQLKPCLQAAGRQRKVWFAGHSLGAALGTIAAIRCKHDPDLPDPEALFTFGSPRVGTDQYLSVFPSGSGVMKRTLRLQEWAQTGRKAPLGGTVCDKRRVWITKRLGTTIT